MSVNIYQNVYIDGYKSFDDWGLVLQNKRITPAVPKINKVEIPARDGALDMTNILSAEERFSNRTITMNFKIDREDFDECDRLFSNIQNLIQGKKVKITFENDSFFYWEGRVRVTNFTPQKGYNPVYLVTITADVFPYKLNTAGTTGDWLWDDFDFELDTDYQLTEIEVHDGLTDGKGVYNIYLEALKYNEPLKITLRTIHELSGYMRVTVYYCGIDGKSEEGVTTLYLAEGTTDIYDFELKQGVYKFAVRTTNILEPVYLTFETRGGSL